MLEEHLFKEESGVIEKNYIKIKIKKGGKK